MSRGLLLLLLMWARPDAAAADELHKCVDAVGTVSYQSAPCAAAARTLWVRTVAPDPVPARPTARVAMRQDETPARRSATTPARAAPRRDAQAARCESARRSADARRDKDWNRLTFRQRSELDAQVARACAG